jgi:superoxide reductase
MEKFVFYHCLLCGNVVTRDINSDDQPICCREKMEKLRLEKADSSNKMRLPSITIDANQVTLSVDYDLQVTSSSRYVRRMYLATTKGLKYKLIEPEDKAVSIFVIEEDEEVLGAYDYCSLDGLWYTEFI